MKFGIHAYAWCTRWSQETLGLVDKVASLGLDFIEIPLMTLDEFDSRSVQQRLRHAGIAACTSTVIPEGMDITSADDDMRRRGVNYLKRCVRATAEIGAWTFTGVIYAQYVKNVRFRPAREEWERSAECLREVAVFAREHGVQIGLEPVNRYETSLVNTCEQAVMLKRMIGEANVKIHLDTYHMNIEEKNLYAAAMLAGDDLVHLHLCENDRGIPGTGLVDWDDLFRALGQMNYQGFAGLESFVDLTDNMNTWVWRQLAPSGEVLVQEGIAFIRSLMSKHGLS